MIENSRSRSTGAPGTGSGSRTLCPPSRVNPDTSTRTPAGTFALMPPISENRLNSTSGAGNSAPPKSRSAPPIRLMPTDRSGTRQEPFRDTPPSGAGLRAAGATGGREAAVSVAWPRAPARPGR